MDSTSLEKDRAILRLIAAGNQQVFDKLFTSYYAYLVSIAYSHTNEYELSKDLVQEVFMDIWRRRATIEINVSIQSFLKRAVINQSISAVKKRNTKLELPEDPLLRVSENNAQHHIEFKELNKEIESLVGKMPEKCRKIFVMSRQENLSHKEIANKLNISTKTIENQITKALKLLRKGLSKDYLFAFFIHLL